MPIVDHQQHVSSNPLKLNDSTSNHLEMYPHPCPRVSAHHSGPLARTKQHTSRIKGYAHRGKPRGRQVYRESSSRPAMSGVAYDARRHQRKLIARRGRRLISKGHKRNESMPCTSLSQLTAATTCPLATAAAVMLLKQTISGFQRKNPAFGDLPYIARDHRKRRSRPEMASHPKPSR